MVLSAFGVHVEEARLRDLTDCSPLGTDAFQLLEAVRQLGFPASRKYTLASLEELATVLEDGNFPIVYIDMWPLQGGRSGQPVAVPRVVGPIRRTRTECPGWHMRETAACPMKLSSTRKKSALRTLR